jgi:hypothetical protein
LDNVSTISDQVNVLRPWKEAVNKIEMLCVVRSLLHPPAPPSLSGIFAFEVVKKVRYPFVPVFFPEPIIL